MREKENVLRILEETKKAISKENYIELKHLSNQTNNTASRTQDPENIAIAVIVYSLSKIIERKQHVSNAKIFYNVIVKRINDSIDSLKKNDEAKLKISLEAIRKEIDKLSPDMKKYIHDVFRKASINKASKIYEHGISMEKTASLLGITMFELASYAGQTRISDAKESQTMDVKGRIKLAMEMFS